jgi:hypothetical protein
VARGLQKEEMSDILADINDDFLMELRLNKEFNRLLAKGGWPRVFVEGLQQSK